MTEEEWFNFVVRGEPDIISVGRLDHELCRRIGSSTSLIKMQHAYAHKSANKHRMRAIHFPLLPIAITCGRVISDKPERLSFFLYENVVFGGWMQATIKIAKLGTEMWVTTFHVASAAEAKRMSKKYGIIRPEKL